MEAISYALMLYVSCVHVESLEWWKNTMFIWL